MNVSVKSERCVLFDNPVVTSVQMTVGEGVLFSFNGSTVTPGQPDLSIAGTVDQAAVDDFAMTFPARVRVLGRDGRERVASCTTPRGGAGHPAEGPGPVSRSKLAAWGPRLWGEDGTDTLSAAIDADDDRLWHCL